MYTVQSTEDVYTHNTEDVCMAMNVTDKVLNPHIVKMLQRAGDSFHTFVLDRL